MVVGLAQRHYRIRVNRPTLPHQLEPTLLPRGTLNLVTLQTSRLIVSMETSTRRRTTSQTVSGDVQSIVAPTHRRIQLLFTESSSFVTLWYVSPLK